MKRLSELAFKICSLIVSDREHAMAETIGIERIVMPREREEIATLREGEVLVIIYAGLECSNQVLPH